MRYKPFSRLLAVVAVLCLLCGSLTACGKARPIKSSKEELTPVGTVAGHEVLYEELRYLTLKYREAMAATYGETIWDNAESRELHRAELEKAVLDNITSNYAVLALCDEVQIKHTEKAIEEAVQKYVQTTVDELGGMKTYREQMATEYLTDHLYRFILAVSFCETELLYAYTDDLGLIEREEDKIYDMIMGGEFARTLHIYIENSAGEDPAENRALAEDILKQLGEGTSFNTLIGRHSEDFYMTTTNGYYFTRGEMLKEYEEAAFALEIGGISGVVETPSGYYIIQRLEPDPQYVMSHLGELIDQYQYAMLYNMIDEKQAELAIEWNDFGKTLDLTTLS
ncbi:MAG: peptidylprolyl isomerase [Clostridia bacterium]|nr:peptidylprolyl isomerase [Clostridia bacterium]